MGEECKHDYKPIGRDYFKLAAGVSENSVLGPYDQSVSYKVLYCARCGDTKEVIAADHRRH